MIAIQTNECLYLINMGLAEFLESAANDALWESNPLIKAKIKATIYDNDVMHFLNSDLSEIKCCARLVGNQFATDFRPLQSTKELEFYVAEDGTKYSCEDAYLLDVAKNKRVFTPINPEVASVALNPELNTPLNPELVTSSEEKKEEEEISATPETPVVEKASEEKDEEEVTPVITEEVSEEEAEEIEEEELDESEIQITEEQKRAAAALDNFIRTFPNIADLPEEYRQGMALYISNCKNMFRENARQFLATSSLYQEDVDQLTTDYFVPNALGKEQEMLDSFLVFPAKIHILSKHNLDNRFLTSSLVNSIFTRVCPIGHVGDIDNRQIQAYVQEFKISREDLKDAEELILEKYGLKSMRSISPEQKRIYFEEALEQVYNNKYGSIATSRNRVLVNDIDEYLSKYAKDYYFPEIENWEDSGHLEFDAREKTEQFPVPIITQLQNLNVIKKVDKTVKIAKFFSNGATPKELIDEPYIEISIDYLPEVVRENIVETEDGKVLMGFVWDVDTSAFLTEEEAAKLAEEVARNIGDPFAEEPEEIEEIVETPLNGTLTNVQNVKMGGTPIELESTATTTIFNPVIGIVTGTNTDKKDDTTLVEEPVEKKDGSAAIPLPASSTDKKDDTTLVEEPVEKKDGLAAIPLPAASTDKKDDTTLVEEPVEKKDGSAAIPLPAASTDKKDDTTLVEEPVEKKDGSAAIPLPAATTDKKDEDVKIYNPVIGTAASQIAPAEKIEEDVTDLPTALVSTLTEPFPEDLRDMTMTISGKEVYISPDGYKYDSKDQYEIFNMFQGFNSPAAEDTDEKGKQI